MFSIYTVPCQVLLTIYYIFTSYPAQQEHDRTSTWNWAYEYVAFEAIEISSFITHLYARKSIDIQSF